MAKINAEWRRRIEQRYQNGFYDDGDDIISASMLEEDENETADTAKEKT